MSADPLRQPPVTVEPPGRLRPLGLAPSAPMSGPPPRWETVTLADLTRRPLSDPGWLLPGLWPGDAYGVIAGEAKAGKSWTALDLSFAVATGEPFLGLMEPERTGPVLYYAGEGNLRNLRRRLAGISAHRGIDPAAVDSLHLVPHPPSLDPGPTYRPEPSSEDLDQIRTDIERIAPVLVVLDPLYLSMGAVNMASLSDVGRVLRRLQTVVEPTGSALIVVHHWNQTGRGGGFDRFSGAGPEEWGRVLWSMAVERVGMPDGDGRSVNDVTVNVRGSEVVDSRFTFRRKIWSDDPTSLIEPLHYEVEPLRSEDRADSAGETAHDRVTRILESGTDRWFTVAGILDAGWDQRDRQRAQRSVQSAAQRLVGLGLAERNGTQHGGYQYRWKGVAGRR